MNLSILELNDELIEKYDVEAFLFHMIKISYKLDYVPEYHYDVVDLNKYYINIFILYKIWGYILKMFLFTESRFHQINLKKNP